MMQWLKKRFGADQGQMPLLGEDFADWSGGRFHLQIGAPDGVILAFGSPVSLFTTAPTAAEVMALSKQLDIFASSVWTAEGVAKVSLPFPKHPPQVLRVMVQHGVTTTGDPEQVVEAQYSWSHRGLGAPMRRGGMLTQTNGQSHCIL